MTPILRWHSSFLSWLIVTLILGFFALYSASSLAQNETILRSDLTMHLPVVEFNSTYYSVDLEYDGSYLVLVGAEPVFPNFTESEYLTSVIVGETLELPCIKFAGEFFTATLSLASTIDSISFNLDTYALVQPCRIAPSPTSAAFDGDGMIDPTTGAVSFEGVTVGIPQNSLLAEMNLAIEETALPAVLPQGLRLVDEAVDIHIGESDQALINAPLKITLSYDDTDLVDESALLPMHFNGST